MHDRQLINTECRVFTRYLSGRLPDACIADKYAAAFSPGQPLDKELLSRFDALVLRLAVVHPLVTRAADAFCRFFCNGSALRGRLVILLAILESRASTVVDLDLPDKASLAGVLFSAALQIMVFIILLGIATLLLLPLKLLLGRGVAK